MGKKTLYCIGLGLAAFGALGTFNAYNDLGKTPVEKQDAETTGVITNLYGYETKHAIGVTLATDYYMKFEFTAADGKSYQGEENLEGWEFESLNEGDEVKVMYHSNNPSINAAPNYGAYVSVDELPSATPTTRLYGCLGVLVCGLATIACNFFFVEDEDKPTAKKQQAPNASPAASAGGW